MKRAAAGLVSLAAIATVGACQQKACDQQPPSLAVYDRGGSRELALRPLGPGQLAVCDARNLRLGTIVDGKDRVLLEDNAGTESGSIARGDEPVESVLTRPGGGTVRLREETGGTLRILDEEGVPLAQLGADEGQHRVIAYSPGGRAIGWADTSGDRKAVHAADGAVTHLVEGVRQDRAAAVFAVEQLDASERALVARWLDRQ